MRKRRRVVIVTPYSREAPSLLERLGRLAGATGWRQPVEGTGTARRAIPVEHELAIALGMARTSDPLDIGPDIAFDIATQSGRHQRKVCEALAKVLLSEAKDHRAIRRNRPSENPFLAVACHAAYVRLVYGHDAPKPDHMPQGDWEVLTDVAERVLAAQAEEAVERAVRALRKAS